jgi:hypothetical protein
MRAVYARRRMPDEWTIPADVQQRRIDPYTGLALQEGCQPRYGTAESELFVPGNLPGTACPYRDWWGSLWDRIGGVLGGDDRKELEQVRGGLDKVLRAPPARERERTRQQDIDDYMRRRSERLRGRGNGGNEPGAQ